MGIVYEGLLDVALCLFARLMILTTDLLSRMRYIPKALKRQPREHMSFIPVITVEDTNNRNVYTKFYTNSIKHKRDIIVSSDSTPTDFLPAR
jgi:hypothetical protein